MGLLKPHDKFRAEIIKLICFSRTHTGGVTESVADTNTLLPVSLPVLSAFVPSAEAVANSYYSLPRKLICMKQTSYC